MTERNLAWISTFESTAQLRERRARAERFLRQIQAEYDALGVELERIALRRRETFEQLRAARRQLQDAEGAVEARILVKKRR